MAVSALASATRAFASVLLALARAYGLTAGAYRDSKPEDLLKVYRRLLLKTHPDKGGKKADLQKLQAAKDDVLAQHLLQFLCRARQRLPSGEKSAETTANMRAAETKYYAVL